MPQENVEIVRRTYDHLSRTGDFLWDLIDPEIEVHDPPSLPDAEVRHGHEGLRAGLASVQDSFDEVRFEVEQIYDSGEDVVVFVRMYARGTDSGVELDVSVAHLITLGGGKLMCIRAMGREEAMEAAGLGG
jgi:ketosteroid isomerase-like protein